MKNEVFISNCDEWGNAIHFKKIYHKRGGRTNDS